MEIALVLGVDSETVNVAFVKPLLPSLTVISLTYVPLIKTCGWGTSSSTIVPVPLIVVGGGRFGAGGGKTPLIGLVRLREKVRLPFCVVLPMIGTEMVDELAPAGMTSVPDVVV